MDRGTWMRVGKPGDAANIELLEALDTWENQLLATVWVKVQSN